MPKTKNSQLNKSQRQAQKEKQKPEWVTSFVDQDKFKLSQAELMQKKISLISKHRIEAKEEWSNLQKKLASGIQDEETKKIYDTVTALKRSKQDVQRKNLSQMIEWQKSERVSQKENFRPGNSKQQFDSQRGMDVLEMAKNILNNNTTEDLDLIHQVKSDLEDTRSFISKVDKHRKKDKNFENPEKLLMKISAKSSTPHMSERKQKMKSDEKRNDSFDQSKKTFFNDEKQMIDNSHKFPIFSQLDNIEQNICFLQDYQKTSEQPQIHGNKGDSEVKCIDDDAAENSGSENEVEKCSFELSAQSNSNTKKVEMEKNLDQINKKLELDELSASKFFKQKKEEQNCQPFSINNGQKSVDLNAQEDDVDALRKLLEQTRIELEKMNLNNSFNSFLSSEFCQEDLNKKSINIGTVKTFQILQPHVFQCQQQQQEEDEINPRQLNIVQQDLKKTVNQFSKKYRNPKNSFNLNDNLMK